MKQFRYTHKSVLFQILFPCYYRILSRGPCDKFLFKKTILFKAGFFSPNG